MRICDANTEEWLEARRQGISASEAAAACGVSEWCTPWELYHRKIPKERGGLPPVEENFPMRFGKFAEPFIESEFEKKTGLRIVERQPGLFCHPEARHILASPDGIVEPGVVGFEGKTINGFRAAKYLGEEYTDEALPEWNIQCQQQMLVMGWKSVWIAVLVAGADLRIYEIQRDDKLIRGLRRKVSDLWQRIQAGNPPDMTSHPNNLEMVRELFGKVKTGNAVTLSEASVTDWQRYEEANAEIKHLKSEADDAKARVLLELGENEAGRLPDGRVVRRKVITKAEYTVKASSYVDARAVSGKSY